MLLCLRGQVFPALVGQLEITPATACAAIDQAAPDQLAHFGEGQLVGWQRLHSIDHGRHAIWAAGLYVEPSGPGPDGLAAGGSNYWEPTKELQHRHIGDVFALHHFPSFACVATDGPNSATTLSAIATTMPFDSASRLMAWMKPQACSFVGGVDAMSFPPAKMISMCVAGITSPPALQSLCAPHRPAQRPDPSRGLPPYWACPCLTGSLQARSARLRCSAFFR